MKSSFPPSQRCSIRFIGGIENIFKRATLELGDRLPGGESWHKELLDAMTQDHGLLDELKRGRILLGILHLLLGHFRAHLSAAPLKRLQLAREQG
jgi:hypothetical protein